MSEDTKVVMSIPQDVIQAQVQAAVAEVLMLRGDDFIRAMVAEVVNRPALDRYDRPKTRTIKGKTVKISKFQELLETSVAKAAQEEAAAWIEEQKGEIKKAMRAHLGRTQKSVVSNIADRIIDGLANPYVSLRMTFGESEDI